MGQGWVDPPDYDPPEDPDEATPLAPPDAFEDDSPWYEWFSGEVA